jgi:hypothetical protein
MRAKEMRAKEMRAKQRGESYLDMSVGRARYTQVLLVTICAVFPVTPVRV